MTGYPTDLLGRLRALDLLCCHEAANEIERLRAQLAGVLDGTHVIVPKEPTAPMLRAAEKHSATKDVSSLILIAAAHGHKLPLHYDEDGNTPIHHWYRAMVAAATPKRT